MCLGEGTVLGEISLLSPRDKQEEIVPFSDSGNLDAWKCFSCRGTVKGGVNA